MLTKALSLLAGIVAFNFLLVAAFAILEIRDAARRRREIRGLEAIWRAHGPGPRYRWRSRHKRFAGVLVVTLLLGATTALASPQGRGVVTSALGMVARGLHGQPAEQEATPVGGDQSSPVAVRSGAGSRGSGGLLGGRGGATPAVPPTAENEPPNPTASTPPQDDLSVPANPTAVTAVSVSSGEVRVDWVDVTGESGYRVEQSMDGVTGWTVVDEANQDVTSTVDGGLAAGTAYYYRVFATNPAGDSTASSVASATTSVDPATPTTVTAVVISASQIELEWTDVGNETGYRVERMLAGDASWLTIATTGEDITHFTDAGLAAGTAYYYRVFATNPGGDSAPSDAVFATTSSDPIIEP